MLQMEHVEPPYNSMLNLEELICAQLMCILCSFLQTAGPLFYT